MKKYEDEEYLSPQLVDLNETEYQETNGGGLAAPVLVWGVTVVVVYFIVGGFAYYLASVGTNSFED